MGALQAAPYLYLPDFSIETFADGTFGDPDWVIRHPGTSVIQIRNSNASVMYGGFEAMNTVISGTVVTPGALDDDVWGMVLGWRPGSFDDPAADYILIDWKGDTQNFNFTGGLSDLTPGGDSLEGLAVSRVTGIANSDELWQHKDLPDNPGGGVVELARGMVSGATNWEVNPAPVYNFRMIYEPTRLQVFVNDLLEVDLSGSFPSGGFGFYSLANQFTEYVDFSVAPIPEPSSLMLGVLGLSALAAAARVRASRRR